MAKRAIIQFIDLFYPPFRRFMPEQTFRYAACGGANTVLGLVLFKILLVYVFKFQNVDLGFYTLKPHNAALFISFIVNFIVGFALMKYIVFLDSNLRGRIQLFRYGLAFLFNLALNYFILKVFVEVFGWWPFLSQCITTAIIISISYLSQKHFSFRTRADN
ncbi:MAG TPA: GtrA family protein [Ferruginibacter sp.]|nr:GtrA family protein [Ferruginibacter sp.]HNL66542.1 GtrA family protein [Ferruginibacter sp.]HNN71688.1 GtrA family protein [Ferruginibacter sp.]